MSWIARGIPATLASLFLLLAAGGCTTTLDGNWEGEMDCGDWGDVDLEFDLQQSQGQMYTGEGEISGLFYNNDPATLTFEIEVTKFKLSGPQEVDTEIDDCEIEISGLGTYDEDCDEPDNVEWDGEDELTGEVEDFLGTGYDCDFEVDRKRR